MATLTILELECVRRQDSVSRDEVRIDVDGVRLVGPISVGRNDVIALGSVREFTGSADITVIEEDNPGTDDNLGTVEALDTQLGTQSGTFHRLSGADYHIRFSVAA